MREICFVIAFTGLLIAAASFLLYAMRRGRTSFLAGTIASLIAYLSLTTDILAHLFSGQNDIIHCTIWLMLTVYYFAVYKMKNRLIGAIFFPLMTGLMSIASLIDAESSIALTATKGKFFMWVHIIFIISSYAIFFMNFTTSIFYMLKSRALKGHSKLAIDQGIPPLEKLHKYLANSFNLSWVLMSVGIVFAFIYQVKTSEEGLGIDTKISWGIIVWITHSAIFFCYNLKKIPPRKLAGSIAFQFILAISFFLYVLLCPNAIDNEKHTDSAQESVK